MSLFKKYHPSGNLKLINLGIFQSVKLRILMKKILPISLMLNFTPNTLGCYGLKLGFCGRRKRRTRISKYISPLRNQFKIIISKITSYLALWRIFGMQKATGSNCSKPLVELASVSTWRAAKAGRVAAWRAAWPNPFQRVANPARARCLTHFLWAPMKSK